MSSNYKIPVQPEYEALYAFDAENGVEPARTTAERIVLWHNLTWLPSLVDDIAHAIEDATELGQKRAKLGCALGTVRSRINRAKHAILENRRKAEGMVAS